MPNRRPRGASVGGPDARALIALLLLTLLLSGLLAFEAEQEAGAHRVASARVLREHLAATGRDALDATAVALQQALTTALGPIVESRAATPYDVLPTPLWLSMRTPAKLDCARAAPRGSAWTCATGRSRWAGELSPAEQRWAAEVARGQARPGAMTDGAFRVVAGTGPAEGRAITLGVKRAPYDAPLAVYGMVTCAEAFGVPLLAAARRTGAAGDALGFALADSLLTIEVHDADGHPLGRATPRATPHARRVVVRRGAGRRDAGRRGAHAAGARGGGRRPSAAGAGTAARPRVRRRGAGRADGRSGARGPAAAAARAGAGAAARRLHVERVARAAHAARADPPVRRDARARPRARRRAAARRGRRDRARGATPDADGGERAARGAHGAARQHGARGIGAARAAGARGRARLRADRRTRQACAS